jgi:hypothetical protein
VSTDFEELVVEGMRRFTAVVRVPADLAARARWQHRRRRTRARASAATGVAIASAVAIIAVTAGTGGPAPVPAPRAQTAAYIVRRAEHALGNPDLILELTSPRQVITKTGAGGKPVISYVPGSVFWGYHFHSRQKIFAAYLRKHGQPGASDTDTGDGPLHHGPGGLFHSTQTSVNYSDRTWSRGTQVSGKAAPVRGPACKVLKGMQDPQADGELLFTTPWFIQATMACGGLSVTGHVRVDGIAAVMLTGSRQLMKLPLVIYISPVTYRLVRTVIGGLRQDYRWLAPTPANLAKLRVPVPPGFRRVEYQEDRPAGRAGAS